MFSTAGVRAVSFVIAMLVAAPAASLAAPEKVLYRIFLQDGTAIVSYGEYTRVADRVVFSIPIGALEPTPQLQLVSISDTAVDWRRTEEYTEAIRARRYAETRGEEDFAILSSHVAAALNDVALTKDPVRRLEMAEEARRNLAEWPKQNYGYRAADVRQLLWMFDDVVSQLRAAAGQTRFDLSLYAVTLPPAPAEPLPDPDVRQTYDQALKLARLASDPAERISLLKAIAAALKPEESAAWAAGIRDAAASELDAELRTTGAYADLSTRMMAAADVRAKAADVNGIQTLIKRVDGEDERLGRRRPQEIAALMAMLDLRLDAARRLRLARDAWALRAATIKAYATLLETGIEHFRRSRRWLEAVRDLAGPAPKSLEYLEWRMKQATRSLVGIKPPAELEPIQSLLATASAMGLRAAGTRRKAIESSDMAVAWEASSAAAGALMMFERALDELNRLTSPPQLR